MAGEAVVELRSGRSHTRFRRSTGAGLNVSNGEIKKNKNKRFQQRSQQARVYRYLICQGVGWQEKTDKVCDKLRLV